MIKKLILGLFFVIFSSYSTNYKSNTSINLEHSIPFINKIVPQKIAKTDKGEEIILNSSLLYNNSLRILIFLIFIFVLLMIITIPVVIFYNLLTSIFDLKKYYLFHKKYFKNKILNTNKMELLKNMLFKYKHAYSNLFGNGIGFLTWAFLTFLYILKNYNNISVGLRDYFNLPFKFLKNITLDNQKILENIPLKIWAGMFLVVFISILNFILGKYIGSIIINSKYKKYF